MGYCPTYIQIWERGREKEFKRGGVGREGKKRGGERKGRGEEEKKSMDLDQTRGAVFYAADEPAIWRQ